jgi:acyl carrier protein
VNDPERPPALLEGIIDVLAGIAPEARDLSIDPDLPLRDQLEMDSMDHLHFAVALKERYGVDIPEVDYARFRCLAELVAYLGPRVTRSPQP